MYWNLIMFKDVTVNGSSFYVASVNAHFSTQGPDTAAGGSPLLHDLWQIQKIYNTLVSEYSSNLFELYRGYSVSVLTVRIHVDFQGCQSWHNIILSFCIFKVKSGVTLLLHAVADEPAGGKKHRLCINGWEVLKKKKCGHLKLHDNRVNFICWGKLCDKLQIGYLTELVMRFFINCCFQGQECTLNLNNQQSCDQVIVSKLLDLSPKQVKMRSSLNVTPFQQQVIVRQVIN